jgi:hypothetical protein
MEPEQRDPPDRPPKAKEEGDRSFSAACLRYLRNRGRRPG